MNTRSVLGLGLAAVGLAACIPSVNPWYTPDDVVFAPELLGVWREAEATDPEIWTFSRLEDEAAYALTISRDQRRGDFKAVLFELGEHRFLDLIASEVAFAEGQHELVNASVFRGHFVLHVASMEPELRIAFFDLDWIEAFVEQNPTALSHRIGDQDPLLTGSTDELQRFLLAHVDGGELFQDYGDLRR